MSAFVTEHAKVVGAAVLFLFVCEFLTGGGRKVHRASMSAGGSGCCFHWRGWTSWLGVAFEGTLLSTFLHAALFKLAIECNALSCILLECVLITDMTN